MRDQAWFAAAANDFRATFTILSYLFTLLLMFSSSTVAPRASITRQALESAALLAFPQFPQASPQDIVVKNR
ncbi:MAG: hypothetical protein KGI75_17895 [Rhizobiaceae bacterium]|nr:hypothetical protein [Rhizobiaceae bacterium]